LRREISGHSGDETNEALKSFGLVRKKFSPVDLKIFAGTAGITAVPWNIRAAT